MGLGQTFVIIAAGIDLSVGWVMSLASVLAALALRSAFRVGVPLFPSVLIGLVAALAGAAAVGLVNGVIIAKLKVPAFIVTLGTSFIVRGSGGLVQTLDDKHTRERSQQTLDALHIRIPAVTEPIEKLSGGQRQAVAIARAVYWDARLMIIDEPTNNLGVPEQHKVLELIRMLKGRGVPAIITHVMPDALAVTDRIIVMHRGRKVTEKITARTNAEELMQYMVGAREDVAA